MFSPSADLRLIAAFIDTEFGEDNAPDHPSSTLRRYAERLRDMADQWPQQRDDPAPQARVAWVTQDILDKYHCLPSEAHDFLEEMEDELQLAMIATGWRVIESECEFERRT